MKMSIKTRLTVIVGGGVLALIMINVIGVARMMEVNHKLKDMTNVNSVKQRYAINFRGSVHDRSIRVRDYVLLNDDGQRASTLSEIKSARFVPKNAPIILPTALTRATLYSTLPLFI